MVRRPLNIWNSLLGWTSILLAGAIYATLTLSPRIVLSEALTRQHAASRARVDELYLQTQQMERAVDTLESDPRLLEEIARSEWKVESADEETITVDADLQANLAQVATQPSIEMARPPGYIVWLRSVSRDESLRGKLMLAAIGLSLVAILSAPRDRQTLSAE